MRIEEKENMAEDESVESSAESGVGINEQAGDDANEVRLSELNDKLLRMAAESENMRRRYEKQIEEARDYSVQGFAKDLISVVDNIDRALSHLPEQMDENTKNFVLGIEMTRDELIKVFLKHKIDIVEPKPGEKFDYNLHSAMMQTPTEEYEPGVVMQLMQKGYKIKDRLLRPAAVVVSKGSSS